MTPESFKQTLKEILCSDAVEEGAAALARLDGWDWDSSMEVTDTDRAQYLEQSRAVLGAITSSMWETHQDRLAGS